MEVIEAREMNPRIPATEQGNQVLALRRYGRTTLSVNAQMQMVSFECSLKFKRIQSPLIWAKLFNKTSRPCRDFLSELRLAASTRSPAKIRFRDSRTVRPRALRRGEVLNKLRRRPNKQRRTRRGCERNLERRRQESSVF